MLVVVEYTALFRFDSFQHHDKALRQGNLARLFVLCLVVLNPDELPNPLVSAAQNVPLPRSSSNEFLYFPLGNLRPGACSLTLPNQPSMPLSTARASVPTAVASPLTEIHLDPALAFQIHRQLITSSHLPTLSSTSFTCLPNQPMRRTNRESRMQNA
jgi:hypothetical protein